MPTPYTLYKQDQVVGDIYPADLEAWINEGWSIDPLSKSEEPLAIAPPVPPIRVILNVNSATLQDLIDLPQLGMAKAKKVAAGQPNYKSIDDLKVILPTVDWDVLSDRLTF